MIPGVACEISLSSGLALKVMQERFALRHSCMGGNWARVGGTGDELVLGSDVGGAKPLQHRL